jgi:molecular chaperone GrpE
MSEQDATDDESTAGDGTSGGERRANGEEPADAEQAAEDLESFAEAPDGDADEVLSAIVGEPDDYRESPVVDIATPAPEEVEVDDELLANVEQSPPETTARAITMLRNRVDALEGVLEERDEEIDDLESRLARKQADFQNYKKRQEKRMEEEKERATEDLVSRLVDVRDNLKRALDQEEGTDIRGGVESTLSQFDDELDRENVTPIEPEPGDEVDPQQMETLATIASDQPEGTVAQVHRDGYEMAGKVIRTAQVAVSDGSNQE